MHTAGNHGHDCVQQYARRRGVKPKATNEKNRTMTNSETVTRNCGCRVTVVTAAAVDIFCFVQEAQS